MKLRRNLVLGLAVMAMGAIPATAGAVSYHPDYKPDHPPQGPKSEPPGKAYGYHCRGVSKKHVKGEKGTPFSQCVKALARADKNPDLTGKKACKGLSKRHVKGQKGTPFSTCVKGVAQMRKEEAAAVAARSTA
ncbi:MAG TPA: hypothetical protein VFZ29_08105 [Solirubrobacterales bacterium]